MLGLTVLESPAKASAGPAGGGTLLWAMQAGPTGAGSTSWIAGLAVSPDGSRVFVTGQSHGAHDTAYATAAYDPATGSELWAARYSPLGGSFGHAIAVSPDGSKVFVTGNSSGDSQSFADYGTVAYDAVTGDQLWDAVYDGPAGSTDDACCVAVSPDGSQVYVTGFSRSGGSGVDYATLGYDATTGEQLWEARSREAGFRGATTRPRRSR